MQRQAIWHAVAQPDAVLDIQQTDMRGFRLAACGGAFQLFLQCSQTARWHPHAIVINADEQISLFQSRTDKQRAGAGLRL